MSTAGNHPLFARTFHWLSRRDEMAGQREFRREALDGLTGRVVELGAGNGLNFEHYPTTVTEIIAVESSDIIIVGNRLDAVLTARDISRRSYRRTKQNVALAFLFNGIGVPLAATGLLYPVWAMLAMVASVTTVFANSLRGNLPLLFSTIGSVGRRQPLGDPVPGAGRS